MAGLTLAQAEAKLEQWLAADEGVQGGQSVRYNDRVLTRADAIEIRNNIDYWNKKCQELEAKETGGGRSRTVAPDW
jgi:hypothetical protein